MRRLVFALLLGGVFVGYGSAIASFVHGEGHCPHAHADEAPPQAP